MLTCRVRDTADSFEVAWAGRIDSLADTVAITTTTPSAGPWPPVEILESIQTIWRSDSIQQPSFIALTPDARLVVADGVTLYVLTPAGELERVLGKRGQGPGEFLSIHGLGMSSGDTVLVWDGNQRRLTWLEPSGRVARTLSVQPPEGFTGPRRVELYVVGSSVLLAWGKDMVMPDGPPDTVAIALTDLTKGTSRSIAYLEDVTWVNAGPLVGPKYPFGPRALYAMSRSGTVALSEGVVYCATILHLDRAGPLKVCRLWNRAPVGGASRTPQEIDAAHEAAIVRMFPALLNAQEFGESRNSIEEIRLDEGNRLWVRIVDSSYRYHPAYMRRFARLRPRRYIWEIFDETGKLARRIALPSTFTLLRPQSDRLFGTVEEDDGTISIARVVFPARRTEPKR